MNNTILLIGRLTKDSELKYTESEMAVCSFSLAIDRDFKKDEADFINCKAFSKLGETINKYTKKGDLVGLRGRLQSRNYEDKEGKKHYVTEVIAEKMTFLQSNKKSDSQSGAESGSQNPYKDMSVKVEASQQFEIKPEDLPF